MLTVGDCLFLVKADWTEDFSTLRTANTCIIGIELMPAVGTAPQSGLYYAKFLFEYHHLHHPSLEDGGCAYCWRLAVKSLLPAITRDMGNTPDETRNKTHNGDHNQI